MYIVSHFVCSTKRGDVLCLSRSTCNDDDDDDDDDEAGQSISIRGKTYLGEHLRTNESESSKNTIDGTRYRLELPYSVRFQRLRSSLFLGVLSHAFL